MDVFVWGLKVVYKLVEDCVFENVINECYSSFKEGIGFEIVEGKVNFYILE